MESEWTWPEPPSTPRDVIAGHLRNWGKTLAYNTADTLLTELSVNGFRVVRFKKTVRKPLVFDPDGHPVR